MAQPKNKGEWYLTDAFQYMIDKGAKIKVIDVEGWYDAGKLDTLLETNRVMLEKGRARRPDHAPGCTIVDPVYVEDGVTLENSIVGPNVSITTGAVVRDSKLRDTIIGEGAKIVRSRLSASLVGDRVSLEGVNGSVTIGDDSEVRVARG